MKVWIVTQLPDPDAQWELGGIFTTEAAADAACTLPTDGYWESELDVDFGRETQEMPMTFPRA